MALDQAHCHLTSVAGLLFLGVGGVHISRWLLLAWIVVALDRGTLACHAGVVSLAGAFIARRFDDQCSIVPAWYSCPRDVRRKSSLHAPVLMV